MASEALEEQQPVTTTPTPTVASNDTQVGHDAYSLVMIPLFPVTTPADVSSAPSVRDAETGDADNTTAPLSPKTTALAALAVIEAASDDISDCGSTYLKLCRVAYGVAPTVMETTGPPVQTARDTTSDNTIVARQDPTEDPPTDDAPLPVIEPATDSEVREYLAEERRLRGYTLRNTCRCKYCKRNIWPGDHRVQSDSEVSPSSASERTRVDGIDMVKIGSESDFDF